MCACSFEEGGRLLCLMVQHVTRTIEVCEEVKYNEDEKLDKLKIVLKELKEDYLVQHLRRSHAALLCSDVSESLLRVGG